MQLVAKYDTVMAAHVSAVQNKSEQRIERQEKAQSKGRGGLVTYVFKTTINKLIQIMKYMLQEIISHEVSQAKYYSIQQSSKLAGARGQ